MPNNQRGPEFSSTEAVIGVTKSVLETNLRIVVIFVPIFYRRNGYVRLKLNCKMYNFLIAGWIF